MPFSAPMVRAILAGTKTQTRRALKTQFAPDSEPAEMCATNERGHQTSGHSGMWWDDTAGNSDLAVRCPYGVPGDRLWVRETWSTHSCFDDIKPSDLTTRSLHYWADGEIQTGKKRPGMFMPRWASRITLEVTGVRVERLQDISEEDAMAEGCEVAAETTGEDERLRAECGYFPTSSYAHGYRLLWEQINGHGSWDANPWVWCIAFRRLPMEKSAC